MPDLFPLFLDLAGRRVVVVGGGSVAARRVAALLDAGARVQVVAPGGAALRCAGPALPSTSGSSGTVTWTAPGSPSPAPTAPR